MEYSGHGKSSGVFTKGNISIWSDDVKGYKKNSKEKQFYLDWIKYGNLVCVINLNTLNHK